jgi:hypothetical protein
MHPSNSISILALAKTVPLSSSILSLVPCFDEFSRSPGCKLSAEQVLLETSGGLELPREAKRKEKQRSDGKRNFAGAWLRKSAAMMGMQLQMSLRVPKYTLDEREALRGSCVFLGARHPGGSIIGLAGLGYT